MILKELYHRFLAQLKNIYSKDEAASITTIIFEWAIQVNRSDLLTHPEKNLKIEDVQKINAALLKLLAHTPVQYVTGEAWFYALKFKVTPAVLIPRPETEELVEDVIKYCKQKNQLSILDIGTGSGCISVAMKHTMPNASITAIDVSDEALAIAKENASLHKAMIYFTKVNFLDENNWNLLQEYDVIVSNPPYIPLQELHNMDKHVTDHEPHTALFVADERPLIFYEKISFFALHHLKKDGQLFMETHEDYANEVAAIFDKQNYRTVIKKDMFGKERFVTATRCH